MVKGEGGNGDGVGGRAGPAPLLSRVLPAMRSRAKAIAPKIIS